MKFIQNFDEEISWKVVTWRLEGNIKLEFSKLDCKDMMWMELVQDCVHWWISGINGAESSGSNMCGLET